MQAIIDYHEALQQAVNTLNDGGVIAYPTEAVYGLGCDPFNERALEKVISIKKRNPNKGLILVAYDIAQVEDLIQPISPMMRMQIESSWPGPVTFVFPATSQVPKLVSGQHQSVAIRVSAHPVVRDLCQHFGGPIVSTSANFEGFPPIRDTRTLKISFKDQIDMIMPGDLGKATNPSTIINAVTGEQLR